MFPRTRSGADRHRKAKREREISISFQTITGNLAANKDGSGKEITVLEFGSGQGFQVPKLEQIGELYASDIYVSKKIGQLVPNLKFTRSSMIEAPFKDGQFDLIYSNHVLEHIEDIEGALKELRRIGKSDCLYAPSEWPIVPVIAVRGNSRLGSSVLFLLKKSTAE